MSVGAGEWSVLMARAGIPVASAVAGGVIGAAGAPRHGAAASPLVYFAAGAFLGIAVLHLVPEGVERAGWTLTLAAVAAGIAGTALLARWAGSACPACDAGHASLAHLSLGVPLVLVLALHSALDGLALAGGGSAGAEDTISLAMLLHKLPEGLAIAALARAGGKSFPAALALTVGVEACTFLGLALGAGLGGGPHIWMGLALGAVAGSFLCLVALTLRELRHAERPALSAGVAAAGTCLIAAARLLFG